MLRFQTEDDAQTGEKVLTCYLLPQQPPPSLGRLLSAGGVAGVGVAPGGRGLGPGQGLTSRPAEDPEQRSSPSESWSDAPLSRVSVIKFLGAPAGDEDAEDAAAEKPVWGGGVPGRVAPLPPLPDPCLPTPHPCAHCRACSVGPHLTPAS